MLTTSEKVNIVSQGVRTQKYKNWWIKGNPSPIPICFYYHMYLSDTKIITTTGLHVTP